MIPQLSSSWNIGSLGQVHASITVNTLYGARHSPEAISFTCSRLVQGIDRNIYDVFVRVIQGQAHFDMQVNDQCLHDEVLGGCGNRRNALSECRCEVLNRAAHPGRRIAYENQVINAIIANVAAQGSSFYFKLGIFGSGELLGEEILLFRLFDVLTARHFTGTLELFFVDPYYSSAISNSSQNGNLSDAVGRAACIKQFLIEIAQCAPQNVIVKGTFFDNSAKYIELAEQNPAFKHHLLIGADIENANFDMGKVGREAGLGMAQPIALVKTKKEPLVCQLDSAGSLENCYVPVDGGEVLSQRPKRQNTNINDAAPVIVLIGMLALAGVAVLFIAMNQSSRR